MQHTQFWYKQGGMGIVPINVIFTESSVSFPTIATKLNLQIRQWYHQFGRATSVPFGKKWTSQ